MEETNRQKKIGGLLQKDLADILQNSLRDSGRTGILISVSKVRVTTDLSIAKAYVSIFPSKFQEEVIKEINEQKSQIKHQMAQRTKHQLRKMPDLNFYIDDSLEYIDGIEKSIKGKEDPISNPDLLDKRKKS
ncbi:30S ribosome-binding factor RbfA [Pontixanthobacter gangjinensis]|uniref:Ribosome-binding factor A n=1 Tax=Christiangramia aestuarii TaxID=1028746 RepID=A0A7K1LRI1_9FLAO|nr:30S ribosome-binding factor RbfA [Christiangramia aestuarii]MUP43409.1 30S ribosome-binding factor RbfA [Christiangramia aestuarii]